MCKKIEKAIDLQSKKRLILIQNQDIEILLYKWKSKSRYWNPTVLMEMLFSNFCNSNKKNRKPCL